jgi:hypothetical protein
MQAQPARWAALERSSLGLSTEAFTWVASARRAFALAFIPYAISRLVLGTAAWVANATLPYGRPQDAQYPAVVQAWLAWDAQHYLQIAREGYPPSTGVNAGFFPLLPLLLHVAGGSEAASLAISFIAGLIGIAVLAGLTAALFGETVARRTAWVAAWWPLGFIWSAVYTEGLFLALAAGAAWAAWRRRAWLAAGLGALAGLLRPTGLFLSAPLWVLLHGRRRLLALAPVAGVALACGYLAWQTGDPLAYPHAQTSAHPVAPGRPLAALSALGSGDWLEPAVGLVLLVLVAVLVVALVRLPRWRGPALTTSAALLAPALLAGTLLSFGRYAMVAFPIFWSVQKARTGVLVATLAPTAVVITVLAGTGRLTP